MKAFTFNRKGEISEKEFEALTDKFLETTKTKALVKAVKFVLYDTQEIDKKIQNLEADNKRLQEKYDTLIKTIQQQKQVNKQLEELASA